MEWRHCDVKSEVCDVLERGMRRGFIVETKSGQMEELIHEPTNIGFTCIFTMYALGCIHWQSRNEHQRCDAKCIVVRMRTNDFVVCI